MKRFLLLGLLAIAACSGQPVASREAQPAEVRPIVTESSEVIAVASVRRRVPGLYLARGVANSGHVRIEVRRASAVLGFTNLTSGTLVAGDTGSGQVEIEFGSSSGYRYLVVVYPQTGGVDDATRAAYIEFVT